MLNSLLLEASKMGNRLFQQARDAVYQAVNAYENHDKTEQDRTLGIAKNALSSAYANSNISEQRQLRELQDKLDTLY